MRLGVALLAAGASRRFGKADKLATPFRGAPLGEHAAAAIPRERCARTWVITSAADHPCEPAWIARGFDPVTNPDAPQGMGTSVALAARLAHGEGLGALLIALADMPLVPHEHFSALIDAVSTPQDIVVSCANDTRMPPAVFGSDHFAALADLSGDTGARALLAMGRVIACPAHWLTDIDTQDELNRID